MIFPLRNDTLVFNRAPVSNGGRPEYPLKEEETAEK